MIRIIFLSVTYILETLSDETYPAKLLQLLSHLYGALLSIKGDAIFQNSVTPVLLQITVILFYFYLSQGFLTNLIP